MEPESLEWTIAQFNQVKLHMGNRYVLHHDSALFFASHLKEEEEVVFSEKVKFNVSHFRSFGRKFRRSFKPGALVVTGHSIWILSKTQNLRFEIETMTAYYREFMNSDRVEQMSIVFGAGSLLYLEIPRKHLDALISNLHKLHIYELQFESKMTTRDGNVYIWRDGQKIEKYDADNPPPTSRDTYELSTDTRIKDEPGSLRAWLRRKYGRDFRYSVGEPEQKPPF